MVASAVLSFQKVFLTQECSGKPWLFYRDKCELISRKLKCHALYPFTRAAAERPCLVRDRRRDMLNKQMSQRRGILSVLPFSSERAATFIFSDDWVSWSCANRPLALFCSLPPTSSPGLPLPFFSTLLFFSDMNNLWVISQNKSVSLQPHALCYARTWSGRESVWQVAARPSVPLGAHSQDALPTDSRLSGGRECACTGEGFQCAGVRSKSNTRKDKWNMKTKNTTPLL